MVAEMIKQGQIVPSEVTVNLLLDAMQRAEGSIFNRRFPEKQGKPRRLGNDGGIRLRFCLVL